MPSPQLAPCGPDQESLSPSREGAGSVPPHGRWGRSFRKELEFENLPDLVILDKHMGVFNEVTYPFMKSVAPFVPVLQGGVPISTR